MPVSSSGTSGLIIISLGILGIIISFLIADRRRYVTALMLSWAILFMGIYHFAGTSLRQWQTARRLSKLQEQQKASLQALQERLQQPQRRQPAPSSAPASSAPAQKQPAPSSKK
jgi:hypothetical protein